LDQGLSRVPGYDQGPIARRATPPNNRQRLKKLVFFGAGTLALAVALLVLLAPSFVDTPAVRAEIQRRLADALHGQVTWQALDVALFPSPRAELSELRIEIPGKLAASAGALQVHLRLWPLLRGDAEVSSLTLVRPAIRILAKGGGGEDAPVEVLKAYRAAMEPAARALQDFAPDMTLRIEDGTIDRFSKVDFKARTGERGVDLELSAASGWWQRLSVAGRVEYADLSARARVELDALRLDADLPASRVRAELRTDGKSVVEGDFEASAGKLGSAKGKLLLPAGRLVAQLDAIDLAQALDIARRKAPSLDAIESAEGRVSAKAHVEAGPPWHVQIQVVKSDATVKLAQLPWKISAQAAHVSITSQHVHVTRASGALGDSPFSDAAARIELAAPMRLSAASGKATLKLEQWLPWLRAKAPLDDIASLSGSVEVALSRLALRFDRPQDVDFEAVVKPRNVSAELKMLPAPVVVSGGAVHAGPSRLRLDQVPAAMLDARAVVSGAFDVKETLLEVSLAEGVTGEKLVRWALERGALPQRLEPRTPLRFAAQRIAWAPKRPLEVDARLEFEGGPAVALALAWQPGRLELRRIAIKDAGSDATLRATIAAGQIEGGFSGTLHGRSLGALLRSSPPQVSGIARGELAFTLDRAQPARSVAEGALRVEALDLSWLAGKRAIVEAIDLSADKAGIRIADAALDLEEQRFRLSGTVQSTDAHPVIDARLESPGVDLVRLLPPPRPRKPDEKETALWPLPVRGRVEVASAFIEHTRYRVEPFAGVLSLEPQRARLEVKEARMCGVSFPLELEATPQDATLDIHLAMKDQPFEKSLHCLTGGTVQITGNADLRAELRTRGRRPHLLRDLTGTAQLALRDGRVRKFALLGNILSVRNIGSVKRMHEEGFPFRTMHARGSFAGGAFLVDEAAFDSDALNLAATGRVDMLGANSRLTVLVGLLAGLDRVAGAIPIVGDIFGGSLTALPVEVRGDIRDPLVVPLGPRAVSNRLLEILGNTAKVPGKLMVPAQ
jgi:hypothetical protein